MHLNSVLMPETPPHKAPAKYLLEARKLSVAYNGRLAFKDISMGFKPNTITALIGPSGCGKSSFLNSLNRLTDLIHGCSVQGCVCFYGESVHKRGTDLIQLRRRIGMIFQKPNPFPLSIRRNLELPLLEIGIKRKDKQDAHIEAALQAVGLWAEVKDRLNSPAQGLSGGQQQRLCIARALTLKPEVLLMDEPCSALDPIASAVVEEHITELKKQYTVVVVTHNLGQARRISDYCGAFWLTNGVGQLLEFNATEYLFTQPQNPLTAAYIEGRKG